MEMNYYLLTTHFKNKLKIFCLFIYFITTNLLANNLDNKINNVLSGYNFAEPSTRNMQDDNFLNPGILWVENGEKLWNKIEGPNKQSCNSCHGSSANMKVDWLPEELLDSNELPELMIPLFSLGYTKVPHRNNMNTTTGGVYNKPSWGGL